MPTSPAKAAPGAARTESPWVAALRLPDPALEVLAAEGAQLRLMNASVERLAGGMRWCEGPVYFGDARCLLWSDIPNNRILRWDEETGVVSVYRSPSNFANGHTRDRQGRLLTCEHGARRITRTEYDGSITPLASHFEGKRLNSPNDIVCKSDGSIWFTDPSFGILHHYEGHAATPELPTDVYRLEPDSGRLSVVASGINFPNGLAFSPDESKLYIVECRSTPRVILAYDLVDAGTALAGRRTLIDSDRGTPDGFRCDVQGNLWCGWGMGEGLDGVRVFSAEGKPLLHIHLPERCANVCFGGPARNRLFMAASHSVYSLYVATQGVAGG
ncbi:MAG: SMP-30/gluconolactonase/LRE family protein [Burkholderiales bacterium]|jgi:gluconolactonase|nr:SMP-30/gluconolactonase/LRE family protein [Burkholderiales bacterium]